MAQPQSNSDRPRTAVVTGTNRGTGKALWEALTAAGYHVVSINRTASGLPGTEYLCDLSDVERLPVVLRRLVHEVDTVDLVVLNAATRNRTHIADSTIADWAASLTVNVAAPAAIISALLPKLRRAAGRVVLIGSHAADRFFEGGALYSSTKAAARVLLETLMLEERPYGVRSTVISPGAIANRESDSSPFKMMPESVARLVVALADAMPPDIAVGEIEIRPAYLDPAVPTGMVRLQSV